MAVFDCMGKVIMGSSICGWDEVDLGVDWVHLLVISCTPDKDTRCSNAIIISSKGAGAISREFWHSAVFHYTFRYQNATRWAREE